MSATSAVPRVSAWRDCARAVGTVADAMITDVRAHDARTTVGELREFFTDEHVHAAVLVDHGVVLTVVDRADVHERLLDEAAAIGLGRRGSRVIAPDVELEHTRRSLLVAGRRRLAVVDRDGTLRGLLCLKRTGLGFCSAHDVRARSAARDVDRLTTVDRLTG